jgi:hypothetical protein
VSLFLYFFLPYLLLHHLHILSFMPTNNLFHLNGIFCRMTLRLQWQGSMVTPLTMKGGSQSVGLTHELPGADVSQGRSPPSQQNLLAMVRTLYTHFSMSPHGASY